MSSVVLVVGGSGGLGTSTLTLAVGRRLAATGPPVVVVDLDLTGGGLDVVAGVEHRPGRRWPAYAEARGRLAPGPVIGSLPAEGGCRVLSAGGPSGGSVPDAAVRDVLASLVDGPARLVVDVPARCAPPHVLLGGDPLVLVLTSLRTRGLADADARVEALLDAAEPAAGRPDLRLVTRGRLPGGDVLDDVVAHLGVSHLAHVDDDPRVARDAERGLWPGTGRDTVRRAADAVVEVLTAAEQAS